MSHRSVEAPLKVFLAASVVIGVVLRYVHLGGQSLWVDEMLTIVNSHIGTAMSASDVFRNLQGPLISLMMHVWGAIGSGEAFLRLPFALAGGLTVVAVFYLARYLTGTWAALHTTFFVAISPMLLWYSQEVRGYVFVVLFGVLMTYFLVRWMARPSARDIVLYGVFLFAALVSNLSAAFIAFAHFLYLLLAPSRRRLLGKWIVAIFVVLLVFSPWVREIMVRVHPEKVVTGDTGTPLRGGAELSAMAVPYSFFAYSVGYSLGPSLRDLKTRRAEAVRENVHWIVLAAAVFAVPGIAGFRSMLRARPNLLLLLVLWLVVPFLAVIALVAGNVKVFTPRYALVAFPAYALIIGQGLSVISRSRFWVITVVLAGLLSISIYNYFSSPAYGKDDARSAAQFIAEDLREKDVVAGVYTAEPLAHYLEGTVEVETFGAGDVSSPENMAARCRSISEGAGRVWLSLCGEWLVDPGGNIRRWFDVNMDLVALHEFPGIQVCLYETRSE
ncbi:MAG: glycosyltransferase family 39 protein [Candidatus Eisenbacteria bacterium]